MAAPARRPHDAHEDCWCGPTVIPVERDNGEIGWVHAHQSGADDTPAQEADRAACIVEAIEAIRQGV